MQVDRRDFLKTGAVAGGGLLLSFSAGLLSKHLLPLTAGRRPAALNAFLRIGSDNSIHIILSKVEMGQGISTTLAMLIAEELDCNWQNIQVTHRPPGKGGDFSEPKFVQSTGGSDSTRSEFDRYRMAGATARTMLVNAAAKRWGVSPAGCRTENGYVIAAGKRAAYGELAAEAAMLPVPEAKLRPARDWKYIGKPRKRLDLKEKITGHAKYGLDLQFPGMLTALVAHPPVFGAKVISFDDTTARTVKGVREVLQIPSGVAVIADHYWAALQGRNALNIKWDPGPHENINTSAQLEAYRELAKTKGTVSQYKGNATAAMTAAPRTIEVEYSFPYLAHAPMEPLNCTVKISPGKCEIWAATQWPLLRQQEVAAFLGLKPEQVLFNTPLIGGSFGRRGSFSGDWVMEAVHIAKASGRFIKLVWSREDDIKGGYYRPLFLHRVQVGLNRQGMPIAWLHHIVGQSLFVNTPLEKEIAPNGIDYASIDGINGSPYLTGIPDHTIQLHTATQGVPVLAWRSVGNTHTCFVMETLIDELAHMAGQDPLAYRRMLLKDHPRHLAALNLAAEKAGWEQPLPAGRSRGIAVHAAMGSYVAQVVELSVNDGKLRLHRVVCAIDCGLAVNPDGVKAQMEGGIVFGLTAALYGEITLDNGRVQQSNFHDYRMLRMQEMPSIDVFIADSTARMGGAGEPGVPPAAPALANALFAATGKRVRRLPVHMDDYLKA